jgi:hypothetical protein
MGSYDLSVWRSARISFINCCQFNDIHDRTRWGIMTSNYAKQLLYDRCTLSRFDAHKGVFGATIQDSSLGHGGIQIIGGGTFTVKNTTVRAANFINLRNDYGSTWNGDLSIQNCTFIPTAPGPGGANIFSGENDGTHDFGYPCQMPARISIDGLRVDDSALPASHAGTAVFGDFTPPSSGAKKEVPYPYAKTREVRLAKITIASGKPLTISRHPEMVADMAIQSDRP